MRLAKTHVPKVFTLRSKSDVYAALLATGYAHTWHSLNFVQRLH
jgi:hypothetical protein